MRGHLEYHKGTLADPNVGFFTGEDDEDEWTDEEVDEDEELECELEDNDEGYRMMYGMKVETNLVPYYEGQAEIPEAEFIALRAKIEQERQERRAKEAPAKASNRHTTTTSTTTTTTTTTAGASTSAGLDTTSFPSQPAEKNTWFKPKASSKTEDKTEDPGSPQPSKRTMQASIKDMFSLNKKLIKMRKTIYMRKNAKFVTYS